MKILLYSMNFHPELTGVGRYSGEMAKWLSNRGHDVRVVCAPPYYPQWSVRKPYSSFQYKREYNDGVTVLRCPLWVPRSPHGLSRVLHLASFALSSLPVMLWQALWRPDVVFTIAPAFACAPAGLLSAKLAGARSWIHIQDFEIDVAFNMGLLKGAAIRRMISNTESFILRRFDIASSISNKMTMKLREKGVAENKVTLFPNWVNMDHVSPIAHDSSYRKELGIASEQFVALFSGSLVGKQGLAVIPEAARILESRNDIVFVICGDGVMKPAIEDACRGLTNIRMLPLQPFERLSDLLGCADVHLLPQSPEAEDLVLPSKLSGMLASGKPVIATCRSGTEIAEIVSQCGEVVPPEDARSLANAVTKLAATDRQQILSMGRRARALANSLFAMEAILSKVERQCASGTPEAASLLK